MPWIVLWDSEVHVHPSMAEFGVEVYGEACSCQLLEAMPVIYHKPAPGVLS